MSVIKLSKIARRMTRARNNQALDTHREDIDAIARSGLFDGAYYLGRYPDVAAGAIDPLEHYVKFGAGEGRNPCASFDTRHYLATNADVVATGMNPFRHYCEYGRLEGRSARARSLPAASLEEVRAAVEESGVFESAFYLRACPEAESAAGDPLGHYLHEGSSAGLKPNPWFDSAYYLHSNPDVADAGVDPLLHFVRYGWKELRNPSVAYDQLWHWLVDNGGDSEQGNPMAAHVAHLRMGDDARVRANGPLTPHEVSRFTEACHSVLAERSLEEGQLVAIGRYALAHKAWTAAEEAFHALVVRLPESLGYRLLLAEAVEKQGRVWQLVDILEEASEKNADNADLFFRIGDAKARMERHAEAAVAFAKAVELKPGNANWHYRHGHALECAGRAIAAAAAYAKAASLDRKHGAAQFGVGALHQERGFWREAAAAYRMTALQGGGNAELWYKLGFARDRCYDWAGAVQAYRVALSMDFKRPYWHYRLGFVLERQGRWIEAAAAYRNAADMETEHRAYWYYRCGFVFEQAGRHVEACIAYLMTDKPHRDGFRTLGPAVYRDWLPTLAVEGAVDSADDEGEQLPVCAVDPWGGFEAAMDGYLESFVPIAHGQTYLRSEQYQASAKLLEARGQLEKALSTYLVALERSPDHVPALHFATGKLLARMGDHAQACDAFRQMRVLKRAYGVDIAGYEKNAELKALMEYNEYARHLPIKQNVVMYESFLGASIGCNPYAIFRDLVERPEFAGWTHVWVVNEWSDIPAEYAGLENVVFIPRNCDAYRRYLATAGYLINNVSFPYWFVRRDGQKYLNTWHGTPLKGLGKDMKGEFMVHGNVTRNFLHATHLISPNAHTSDVLMKRYDVAGIHAGELAETGYPRIDQVVKGDERRKRAVLKELGLTPGTPVVLYAPTWRGAQGTPETDIERLVSDVTAMVGDGYQLVFRGHHFMEAALAEVDLPITVAPQRVDTCDLLSVVDVLVTDYSSIFFDFLPSGRPIVYHAYDLEEYAQGRGFYFDLSELPGTLCREVLETRQAIEDSLHRVVADDTAYQQAVSRFCPFEDGHATRRTIDFFFHDAKESVVDRYKDPRKSIVMYNGMFPANGITSSYLNLVRSLESMDVQVTTLFDPGKIRIDPVRVQKFEAMPDYVKCVAREGRMVMDPEEIWITSQFESRRTLECDEMWGVLRRAYKGEYRRVFGDMKHHAFVNFEGYNALTSAIGTGAPAEVVTTMYMHNDMVSERNLKLPYLDRLFNVYGSYDHLVSVSRAMNEVNRRKLGIEFQLDESKFTSCDNTIDIESILSLSMENLDEDLVPWFAGGRTFLAIGRMSPEKDHAKLLRAFSNVVAEWPDARLVVLGDGPLWQDLVMLIDTLGLAENVKLAGLRMNPFPALKASGCFVLSSNHEGQPMVLLEAMTLGKPIVATDIDGNRGVLGDDRGELVENSEAGLMRGMTSFLQNGGRAYAFSSTEYQREAVGQFMRLVLDA